MTDLPIRVDANEGWDLESAHALLPQLEHMGVELVEQPFAADDLESFRKLARFAHGVPIMIDEGCHTLRDMPGIARVRRRHQHQARQERGTARGGAHGRGRALARAWS